MLTFNPPIDLTEILASSTDWDELLWAWQGWRDVSGKTMPDQYEEFAGLLNKAAGLNGKVNEYQLPVLYITYS